MLCHPQQIASTKTNLLLYDKRTCLGRNKLNLGVVIWAWCLHIWPMQRRPAEVRVSNYNTGVLRMVQRDAEANGVFAQPTGPWGVWVLLELSVPWLRLLREFGRVVREQSCALSVPSMWGWFEALWGSRGEASPRAPRGNISPAPLRMVLPCGKGLGRDSSAGSSGCLSLQPMNPSATGSRQRFGAGCQVLLVCFHSCSFGSPSWGAGRRWAAWRLQGLINF